MDKKLLKSKLEDNIRAKFSYIPTLVSSMQVLEIYGTLVINSQLKSDMFNIICCNKSDTLMKIDSIILMIKEINLSAAWWVGFSEDPLDIEDGLQTRGFKSDEDELAMATSLETIIDAPHNEIKILKVTDKKTLDDFISVITTLIPEEGEPIEQYFSLATHHILNPKSLLHLFVGYINEQLARFFYRIMSQEFLILSRCRKLEAKALEAR